MTTAHASRQASGDLGGGPTAVEIDRTSPVPLYHQVSLAIRHAIREGRFPARSPLPTEAELCALYGVSRITVRQALADLVKDHLLVRERSRGPLVVKSAPIAQRLERLSHFFIADALAQGHHTRFVLQGSRRVGAEERPSGIGLDPEEPVVRVDRLLVERDEALAIVVNYVPERRCPDLLDQDLGGSLMVLIEARYGHRYADASQRIATRNATEAESRRLGVPRRAAVVEIKRLTRTADGEPIEFMDCLLRGDRYEFVMELPADSRDRH